MTSIIAPNERAQPTEELQGA